MMDGISKKEAAQIARDLLVAALGVEKVNFNIPQLVTSYQMIYKGVLDADNFKMPEIVTVPTEPKKEDLQ